MDTPSFQTQITNYILASFPVLFLETAEEQRCEQELRTIATKQNRPIIRWTLSDGLIQDKTVLSHTTDPIDALKAIKKLPEGSLILLLDYHLFLDNPHVIRGIKDLIPLLKTTGRMIVILGCKVKIPLELEKDLTVLRFQLPTRNELALILTKTIEDAAHTEQIPMQQIPVENREALLDAALGLTASEAENAFTLAYVAHGQFNAAACQTIQKEKASAVKKTGILEYYEPDADLHSVGGLQALKAWLRQRARAFSPEAKQFGLPPSRGVLLVGVPGSGKSLVAKCTATTWGLPLLRLDFGKVFGALVGSSEENVRKACELATAIAPCVLWVDEIEKGLAGMHGSSRSDSGVTARVLGTFLTWAAEKTDPVFIIATANDIDALPPELLRKGRFDEIFWVDLPNAQERQEIFSIHLQKRGRKLDEFSLPDLASRTEGFGGSEIEEVVISGLYTAFDHQRDLAMNDLISAIETTVSLSSLMKERIESLREWAKTRARAASTDLVIPTPSRRLMSKQPHTPESRP